MRLTIAQIRAITVAFFGLINVPTANALINGKPLEGKPDLVRLVFVDGTMCTGVYIDEVTILTAAHCLLTTEGETFHKLEKILSKGDRILPVDHLKNIFHPKFDHGWWPAFDIGIIRTSKNSSFEGNFKISRGVLPHWGQGELFGCGISEFEPKTRSRSYGRNAYLKVGSLLFFLGKSHADPSELGEDTSIAPNDSGGPIVESETDNIIGVSTQTTAKESAGYSLPALSVGTSIVEPETLQFVLENLSSPPKQGV